MGSTIMVMTTSCFLTDGNDDMEGGTGDDIVSGRDGVKNNDKLDGGSDIDFCESDPDPTVNCERP